jgi:hypothetical protein
MKNVKEIRDGGDGGGCTQVPITLFTTAKAFEGHSGIIQRNALKSWTLLDPNTEVILFGDDGGAAEVAREWGLRHEPYVERNEFGTKRLDYIFQHAQAIARHDVLCYVNCDIILFPEFMECLRRVKRTHAKFLMVGRRWDTDVSEPLAFAEGNWSERLRQTARTRGVMQPGHTVDYFAFRRGLYREMPALVVGRIWWDHWLVWKAGEQGAAVVDVTQAAMCIHQNHNYGYHPNGASGVRTDEQARRNFELAGGRRHLHTIEDASYVLTAEGERANWRRLGAPAWRVLRPKIVPVWHALLDATRPLRQRLGLRRPRAAPIPARMQDPAGEVTWESRTRAS